MEKACTRWRDSDVPASAGAYELARRARQVCRARLNFRHSKNCAPRQWAGREGAATLVRISV